MIESITIDNAVEIEELNKLAEKVQKPEEAADIIKQYQEILRTKRKDIKLSRQAFQTLQGKGKVYTNGRKVKDSQKYFTI